MMNSVDLCVQVPECAHSCPHADAEPSVPAAGDFWNAPASAGSAATLERGGGGGGVGGGGGGCGAAGAGACKSRAASVAYVLNSESGPAESAALQCLRDACDATGCPLDVVHFGKLDFGEMAVLDQFYNAGGSRCIRRTPKCHPGAEPCPSYIITIRTFSSPLHTHMLYVLH